MPIQSMNCIPELPREVYVKSKNAASEVTSNEKLFVFQFKGVSPYLKLFVNNL